MAIADHAVAVSRAPAPAGLQVAGQRALAVSGFAVVVRAAYGLTLVFGATYWGWLGDMWQAPELTP